MNQGEKTVSFLGFYLNQYFQGGWNQHNQRRKLKEYNMATHNAEQIKTAVREHYADLVKNDESCCSPSSCCATEIDIESSLTGESANQNGYTDVQLSSIPADAVENSFGCGNPLMYADICEGEVVLDLGSGAGIDVLLAASACW